MRRAAQAALAGAAAAGAWALAEPSLRRLTGGYHSQARLVGAMIAPRGRWKAAGLGIHLVNGAMFGVAFERLGMGGVRQGVWAAEAENVLLWPLTGVLDRLHPDVRAGVMAADGAQPARVRPGGAGARGVRGRAGGASAAVVGRG